MEQDWLRTLDDMYKDDNEGNTDLVRADLNSPVKDGIVQMNRRLVAHAETLYELANHGSKVVVIAHQGRCGDEDYVSLRQHAGILSGILKEKYGYEFGVDFYDELLSEGAERKIKELKNGRILLLENTRFYADANVLKDQPISKQADSRLVKFFSRRCNRHVTDGYEVAHRSGPDTTGLEDKFGDRGPVYCGRVMEREIKAIGTFRDNPEYPLFCALGGAKPEDSFSVASNLLEKHGNIKIAFGGVILNIVLKAKGYYIGKSKGSGDEYEKYVWVAKDLLKRYGNKIILPDIVAIKREGGRKVVSVAGGVERNGMRLYASHSYVDSISDVVKRSKSAIVDGRVEKNDMILDASHSYISSLSEVVKRSKSVIMNGLFGTYEKDLFDVGTNELLISVAYSRAKSFIAGGHTIKAVDNLKISGKFDHESVAGGAAIWDLSGRDLPVIKLLKQINKRWKV